MYAGHFASALAIKANRPKTPTWALLVGVGLLDILFGPFVLLGIERAKLTPGQGIGFSLTYIDWSHSLAMALVWSALFALPFLKRGRDVALTCGFAVFSHYLLDLTVHPPDLALWPGSRIHLGLGLWETPYWWWFELAFVLACGGYYWRRARMDGRFGGRAPWAIGVIVLLHVLNSPWMKMAK